VRYMLAPRVGRSLGSRLAKDLLRAFVFDRSGASGAGEPVAGDGGRVFCVFLVAEVLGVEFHPRMVSALERRARFQMSQAAVEVGGEVLFRAFGFGPGADGHGP
jgi:hypothetical protein